MKTKLVSPVAVRPAAPIVRLSSGWAPSLAPVSTVKVGTSKKVSGVRATPPLVPETRFCPAAGWSTVRTSLLPGVVKVRLARDWAVAASRPLKLIGRSPAPLLTVKLPAPAVPPGAYPAVAVPLPITTRLSPVASVWPPALKAMPNCGIGLLLEASTVSVSLSPEPLTMMLRKKAVWLVKTSEPLT